MIRRPAGATGDPAPVRRLRDRIVFHQGAERVLAAVPGARLELLKGIGHCPQIEAPDRFAELLLDFSAQPDLAAA